MTDTPSTVEPAKTPATPRWRRRARRGCLGLLVGGPLCVVLLWLAVHTFPSLGPAFADGLRSVIGVRGVSWLEEVAYGLEDRFNQLWRADEAPKAYWDVPSAQAPLPPPPPDASASGEPGEPALTPFRPDDVGPMFKQLFAKGDGVWVPVADPAAPDAPPVLYKTLLHPDVKRPWAELFVVALDMRLIDLHVVAGSQEPEATTPEGRAYARPAIIPEAHHGGLLAAFNGGFKAAHGRWGMKVDGVEILKARHHGCTIARYQDGSIALRPWYDAQDDAALMVWYRQTPPCMFHDGKRHPGLWDPDSKGWGAALEGDTVIRRSAMGMNPSGTILFVSMSNHTSAQAIAAGMEHAGADDVAQLDVNWSFPRFVMFPLEDGKRKAESLFPGFEVEPGDYLRDRMLRDFFYLTRR